MPGMNDSSRKKQPQKSGSRDKSAGTDVDKVVGDLSHSVISTQESVEKLRRKSEHAREKLQGAVEELEYSEDAPEDQKKKISEARSAAEDVKKQAQSFNQKEAGANKKLFDLGDNSH